ncbi:transporter substrate-binding domain-containing protein [Pseudoclavibacter helvolus]|uniref:ABC-type amino acid transport substrate-binding protein n=1 Tax=Pseudoclavibacter helvolus TaxID=255205 RepID=A0A7W4UQK5_9MICO|nr:transporter substrate-binding domain-containing protein [Pseudoclavibacter helvolus]MBB2958776.1 ABC-type amino acid transport substrate-binding protein [Pseudoclavibacter helvolus]
MALRVWGARKAGRPVLAVLASVLVAVTISGCGMRIPSDPDGTLDRVRGGELRVGISHNPPFTSTSAGTEPTGVEVELVEGFAEEMDASVTWVAGSEAALVQGLEDGNLDLAIAGFRDDSPFVDEAGSTRPFLETEDAAGGKASHVMLTPMGENAFLVELETYLAEAAS